MKNKTEQKNTGKTGEGNNSPPPQSVKKPLIKTRKFIFTTNNYTTEQYSHILCWLKTQKVFVVGKEVGASGTPHLQGYVETKSPMSYEAIGKHIDKSFIEKKKGTDLQAILYCMKDGNFETNSKYRPKPKLIDPMEGKTLYPYQQQIKDIISRGGNDRIINWFWEPNGNVGKSSFCKHLCIHNDKIIILGGKGADMLNGVIQYEEQTGQYPQVVILDIPRCIEHISYGGIENLKDGCFFSGKYKGGMVLMNSPTIIVFSNQKPDTEKMSGDRWNIQRININNDSDDEDIDSDSD